jgi:hypothetical protein
MHYLFFSSNVNTSLKLICVNFIEINLTKFRNGVEKNKTKLSPDAHFCLLFHLIGITVFKEFTKKNFITI